MVAIALFGIFSGCTAYEKTLEFQSDMLGKSEPKYTKTGKWRSRKINKHLEKCGIEAMYDKRSKTLEITQEMIECDSTILKRRELKRIEIRYY